VKERLLLICFSSFLALASSSAAEGAWLSAIPKAERTKTSSLFVSIGARLKKISEDHAGALRHEAQYAKKARFLARSLDLASAAAEADSDAVSALTASLADQRRLRWESAVDLAGRRYGRVGGAGFEAVGASEKRLEEDGAVLAGRIAKHLAKMRPASFSALLSDLESRAESHPDCPKTAFAALRAAAASLPPADRRRWALSLVSGLPRGPVAAFADLLPAGDAAALKAAPSPGSFAAALAAYRDAMDAASALFPILPAAAALSWHVDVVYSPLPPQAAASAATGISVLSAVSVESLGLAAGEFPWLSSALSEYSSLLWIILKLDPAALSSAFGSGTREAEAALSSVWRMGAAEAAPVPELDLNAVRAAERMAQYLEGDSSAAEILASFAALRDSPAAMEAFSIGQRYAPARRRILDVLAPAFEAAAASYGGAGSSPSPVLEAVPSVFGPFAVSVADSDGRHLAPARFGPQYALSLSGALGYRGSEPAAAAAWLESKDIFLSIPCIVRSTPPSPEELDALADGSCFYPSPASSPTSATARNEFVRRRLAAEAALAGVPLRFVDSTSRAAERLAVLYSGPIRYRGLAARRSAR
jgi:hypothetical protein